jgi:hypothetical protein
MSHFAREWLISPFITAILLVVVTPPPSRVSRLRLSSLAAAIVLSIGLNIFAVASIANAQLLYSQPVDPALGGRFSNIIETVPTAQQVADNFRLTEDAILTDVHWYGGFENSQLVTSIDVQVRLFADDSGGPLESPFYAVTVTASAIDTGLTMPFATGSVPLLEFRADPIPEVVLSAGVTYWISILPMVAVDTEFLWASTAPVDNDVSRGGDTGTWTASPALGDRAFALTGIQPPFPLASSGFTPTIDGRIEVGEWNLGERIEFSDGYVTVRNDYPRLYVLLNLTGLDQRDDDDAYRLVFDNVSDGTQVEYFPDLEHANGNLRYMILPEPTAFVPFSSRAASFDCHLGDGSLAFGPTPRCDEHRVFEFAIDLAEIGRRGASNVRMGIELRPSGADGFGVPFGLPARSTPIEITLAPAGPPPWFPTSGTEIALQAQPLELTQAIQDRHNSLPLVADKKTVARVYAEMNQTGGGFFAVPFQTSIVSLYGRRGNTDLPGSPLTIVHAAPNRFLIDEEQLDHTANFELKGSWTRGTLVFRAVVRDLFNREDASGDHVKPFRSSRRPTFWVVPINTGTDAAPNLPANAQITAQEDYTKATFPVPFISFVRRPWQDIGATVLANVIADLREYRRDTVMAYVQGFLSTGSEPFVLPSQIYGFTPNGGGVASPTWCSGAGHVARGFRGTSREGTMAHEITHNLDRSDDGSWGRHVDGCLPANPTPCNTPDPEWPFVNDDIQEVGFDTRLPWVDTTAQASVVPDEFPDFMSYCQSDDLPGFAFLFQPTKWISTYRWKMLFSRFSDGAGFAAGGSAAAEASVSDVVDVLYVAGEIRDEFQPSGSLDPILAQPGLAPESVPAGDYAVDLLATDGSVLSSQSFFISFVDVEGEPLDVVPFAFRIEAPEEQVKTVVLRHGARTLDSVEVSRLAPQVRVVAPSPGNVWGGGIEIIEWEAVDGDSTSLSFVILFSTDGGATWLPLARNLSGSSHQVDSSALPGSEAAKIRVIATDGFNTVSADSERTFSVVASPPQVEIVSPVAADSPLELGNLIEFLGQAFDADPTPIPDDAFVWSVEDRVIGSGREILVSLEVGVHQVSLRVFGASGTVGEDTVDIQVVRPVEDPIDSLLGLLANSVAIGTLTGSGPRASAAAGRLVAFHNMLQEARNLIDEGLVDDACGQLKAALRRTDGMFPPPDFVEGEAAPEIYDRILEIQESLGCH